MTQGAEIIKDRNAGNSANTYWRPAKAGGREYCIAIGDDYARDAVGRVRRFATRDAAERAFSKIKGK